MRGIVPLLLLMEAPKLGIEFLLHHHHQKQPMQASISPRIVAQELWVMAMEVGTSSAWNRLSVASKGGALA